VDWPSVIFVALVTPGLLLMLGVVAVLALGDVRRRRRGKGTE
jgi:hypothetical protein